MSRCLLYSGGLDSTCAWQVLGRPDALYVGGQLGPARYANDGELAAIERQASILPEFAYSLKADVMDFRPFMRKGEYNFPRDLVLLMRAWALGYDDVMIAWVKDDGTTRPWADMQAENFAKHIALPGLRVSFPVAHMTKSELVSKALEGLPAEFIHASHSCVRSSEPCGECNNCKHREAALCQVAA